MINYCMLHIQMWTTRYDDDDDERATDAVVMLLLLLLFIRMVRQR